MPIIAVTLVISMLIGAQEVERRERVASLAECWDRARVRMDELRAPAHDGLAITRIGVGCVVDTGEPL